MSETKVTNSELANAYSTSEILSGETWIDGKPIYRQTFSISITGGGSEQVFGIGLTSSATRIIKIEGGNQTAGSSPDYYPAEYINPGATTLQNMQLKLSVVSGVWQIRCNTGATGTLIATIYYVK